MIRIDIRAEARPDGEMVVHSAGRGRAAVLVHGFPLDHRTWLDQIQGLAGDDRRLLVPDLRGHGASGWGGDSVHTMEMLAADVAALIESAGGEPVDLVGLSMGGYVALALIESRPELVRTLALVDTKAGADSADGKAGRDATAAAVTENGRRWLADQLLPKLVQPDALLAKARTRTMIEAQPVETIVADLAGMRDRPDRTPLLASIDIPTLVLVGEADILTPPSESEAMAAALPASRLVTIPGSGHMSPVEAPQAVNQALAELWASTR